MQINFDTSNSGPQEGLALIALLMALYPNSGQLTGNLTPQQTPPAPSPKNEEQAIVGVPDASTDPNPGPAPTTSAPAPTPTPINEPAKRTRRTKAEIAADEAAKNVPAASAVAEAERVAQEGHPEEAEVILKESAATPVKPITADELRTLLNAYIAKHSMEDAIGQLKAYGCNRVSEALTLVPAELNGLAEALRG